MEFFTIIIATIVLLWIYKQNKKRNAKKIEKENTLYKATKTEDWNISYQVKAKCPFCQSISFDLPYDDYIPEDEEEIKCSNCGKFSEFSTLKQAVIDEEVNKVMKTLKDAFSCSPKEKEIKINEQ